MADSSYPDNYAGVHADETVIEDARGVKNDLGLSWTQFLRRATIEMDADSN